MAIEFDLLEELIKASKSDGDKKVSDIFIVAGRPLCVKIHGEIVPIGGDEILRPDDTKELILKLFELAGYAESSGKDNFKEFLDTGDADFSFAIDGAGRFRVSTYKQRGSLAAAIRVVAFELPSPESLGVPDVVMNLHKQTKGLILVTGPTGSGKSTTLACLIHKINTTRRGHIITIEEPIEFLHRHKESIVSQREIPSDSISYLQALKASLRHTPDVILVGEMRDLETINTVLTAAETGHLIFSSLHTINAANTIDRIVDVFPPSQQDQVKVQLSMVLQAVVCQRLLPTVDNKLVAAFEVMINNTAISTMIRESKIPQINTVIHTSSAIGMVTMDTSILNLYKAGRISKETAITYSLAPTVMERQLG